LGQKNCRDGTHGDPPCRQQLLKNRTSWGGRKKGYNEKMERNFAHGEARTGARSGPPFSLNKNLGKPGGWVSLGGKKKKTRAKDDGKGGVGDPQAKGAPLEDSTPECLELKIMSLS